jgi:hypothetical protein
LQDFVWNSFLTSQTNLPGNLIELNNYLQGLATGSKNEKMFKRIYLV